MPSYTTANELGNIDPPGAAEAPVSPVPGSGTIGAFQSQKRILKQVHFTVVRKRWMLERPLCQLRTTSSQLCDDTHWQAGSTDTLLESGLSGSCYCRRKTTTHTNPTVSNLIINNRNLCVQKYEKSIYFSNKRNVNCYLTLRSLPLRRILFIFRPLGLVESTQ